MPFSLPSPLPYPNPNQVLAALSETELKAISPHFAPCLLHMGQTLYERCEAVSYVYFPKNGLISLVLTSQSGVDVEIGLIGREGVLGVLPMLGDHPLLVRATVQLAGSGWRIPASKLRELCAQSPDLTRTLLRAVEALHQQTAQCALCNRLHSLDQRLTRWLLMCQDRAQTDTLELTHEVIGKMLGMRRVGVTLACGELREAGLIEYSRGRISIIDRIGLEARTCECYAAICRDHREIMAPIPHLSNANLQPLLRSLSAV